MTRCHPRRPPRPRCGSARRLHRGARRGRARRGRHPGSRGRRRAIRPRGRGRPPPCRRRPSRSRDRGRRRARHAARRRIDAVRASARSPRRPRPARRRRRDRRGCRARDRSRQRAGSSRHRTSPVAPDRCQDPPHCDRRPRESDAEDPEPGCAPHHDRRRGPADGDRLLGGPPRDAVRVRAAESRQRSREPPVLRPGRRAAHHRLHERGAVGRPRAALPRPGHACTTSPFRSRRRPSGRSSSGSTSEGFATPASRTAASWTRSTSTTRSAS